MKGQKIFATICIILLINIILTGFLEVTTKRPIIYYEYIFLPLILIIVERHLFRTLILVGLILLDIIYNLSHLYYFDIFNYVEKLPYLFIAKFDALFYLYILIGFIILVLICNYLVNIFEIKIKSLQEKKYKINIIVCFSFFLLVYIIDSLNGSSLLGAQAKGEHSIYIRTKNKKEYNIGKSLVKDLYTDYNLYKLGNNEVHEIPDFKNLNGDSSLSYKYFYNSTGNKEVLIILESWGMYKNEDLTKSQIAPFFNLDSNKYRVKFERSFFDGATLQAEARELLNKEGEAYFSVINHDKCEIKGLVQKKNEENYKTLAVQPFDGTYSVGTKFKKLIGFQDFKDYKYFHDTLKYNTIFNNQYQSVLDEQVFSYLFENTKKSTKNFSYCLSINTHLPFHLTRRQRKDPNYITFAKQNANKFPDEKVLQRYYRMKQELATIASLIDKTDVDKVLIVGDHVPPYLFKIERDLFYPNIVPAILIEKRNQFK